MKPALRLAPIKTLIAFVITCLLTVQAFAAAPTVVKTTPEAGDNEVDPALRKIVIEFDQDMNRSGHSITGGGDSFPELTGNPRWQDKRTLILPVKLKPNHDYYFGINSPSFKNTRSIAGEPVAWYRVKFRTADGEAVQEDLTQAELNTDAIDALKAFIDHRYAYRDRLGLDWDQLFTDHEQTLIDAESPKRFAQIAGVMLSKAQDKHLWLDAEGDRIRSFSRPMTPNANAQLLPTLVPNYIKINDVLYVGLFEDGIGYARIDSWSSRNPFLYEKFFQFIGENPDAPGIIIDVRFNGGGSETVAGALAACFITEPVVYAKHVYSDPDSESGFTPVSTRTLPPNTGRPSYKGKVAVLSGPVVMSSCEAFILMMKQAPNATVFGQTTQGSSGNPKPYNLGNGVTVYLPSWKAMRPDGTEFEGEGIEPDILIDTKPTDFKTSDPVLDAALEHLRN